MKLPFSLIASFIPMVLSHAIQPQHPVVSSSFTDIAYPALSFLRSYVGCPLCKLGIGSSQLFFNFGLNQLYLSEYAVFVCYVIAPFSGFSGGNCPTIVQFQFRNEFLPVVTDGLFSEETMCTFILPLCDTQNWIPIDLNVEIQNQLLSKVAIAQENDFVNEMYR